jgi:predicted dienelactone hydrolase
MPSGNRHRRLRFETPTAKRVVAGAVGALLLVATAITVTALTAHPTKHEPATTSTTSTQPQTQATSTSSANPTTQAQPPISSDGSFAVGTTSLSIVEPAGVGATADRLLPTAVFYPGRDAAAAQGTGLQPDRIHAPYPLLVFSQGYDSSVQDYSTLLAHWASAGFVVAAPTYPHTDPSNPGALDESDIANHPADLHQVITALLNTAHGPGAVLTGLIDANEIGVVGHSDGAEVSLAVAANSCCQDPRVKAAAILSGAELASFGGHYVFSDGVALLVAQGNADIVNLPACSAQIYNAAGPDKFYLDLLGASHKPPYADPGPDQEIVARVTTDFFHGELAGQKPALTALTTDGNVEGRSSLSVAAVAPQASGQCPGAPS